METTDLILDELDELIRQAREANPGQRYSYVKDMKASENAHSVTARPSEDAPTHVRLEWCYRELKHIRDCGFIHSLHTSRESIEQFEKQLRARFHQMNKGSSRDKNIASWMESTYTEFAEDERRKMSQDSYRRNTMRTKSRAIKDPRRRLTLKARSNSAPEPPSGDSWLQKPGEVQRGFSTGKLGTETQSSIEGSTVEGGTEFYECSDAEHQKRAQRHHRRRAQQNSPRPLPKGVMGLVHQDSMQSTASSDTGMDSPRSSNGTRSRAESSSSSKKYSLDACMSDSNSDALISPTKEVQDELAKSFRRVLSRHGSKHVHDPSDECAELLKQIDRWDFDIFSLHKLSEKQPLVYIGMKVLHDRGLIDTLKLDVNILSEFFTQVEAAYLPEEQVIYHNSLHAADVLHSVHCLLDLPIIMDAFSDLELFSAIIAAAVHDMNHPGRTNAFLIKTSSPLAILYNDISVLENHHIASAFNVMKKPGCNIFSNFDDESKVVARKLIIDMVLGTDMAKHTKALSEFRTLSKMALEKIKSQDTAVWSIKEVLEDSVEDRTCVLRQIVHSADLGATAKSWSICESWTHRIMEEFYQEGDEERRLGLTIGALNDREKVFVPKAQVGFINFITLPLWSAWGDLTEQSADMIQLVNLRTNLEKWQAKANEQQQDDSDKEEEEKSKEAKADDDETPAATATPSPAPTPTLLQPAGNGDDSVSSASGSASGPTSINVADSDDETLGRPNIVVTRSSMHSTASSDNSSPHGSRQQILVGQSAAQSPRSRVTESLV